MIAFSIFVAIPCCSYVWRTFEGGWLPYAVHGAMERRAA